MDGALNNTCIGATMRLNVDRERANWEFEVHNTTQTDKSDDEGPKHQHLI